MMVAESSARCTDDIFVTRRRQPTGTFAPPELVAELNTDGRIPPEKNLWMTYYKNAFPDSA